MIKNKEMKYEKLLDRFLDYVKLDTHSDVNSQTVPTTQSQVEFAHQLAAELEEIGLTNIHYIEDNGYVIGTIPANTNKNLRKIGFITHMDTVDFNDAEIRPQITENYDGESKIPLTDSGYFLDPADFPNLRNYAGDTLIHTDGRSLLGADDKSGIAEVMTMADYLIHHPELEHGEIRIAFGPDEEIGRGAHRFDIADFDVDFAYTADNGLLGEIEYETFNASEAVIQFQGKNVHPGTAKNQMVNALQLAVDFHELLPEDFRPERTEGYEGFYHLKSLTGTPEYAEASYIVRDFAEDSYQEKKDILFATADKLNRQFAEKRVKVILSEQYENMAKVINKDISIVEIAQEAMRNLDIEPKIVPFRGGTDGSIISAMGLPTPNLFAGGENCHGRFEFVSLQTMEKSVDVFLEIIRLNNEVVK